MRRLRLASALPLLACSTVQPGPGPGEDGMYSDEVGIEVDGVLVQCGNMLDANCYWTMQSDGPDQVRIMPIICVGSVDTPGFELESAELVDGRYQFPEWEAEIRAQCAAGCMAAHDPNTDQTPVCVEENFAPNATWGDWVPMDGPNCDSTVLPSVQSEPGLDVKNKGDRS
jgi:hypothetical protein